MSRLSKAGEFSGADEDAREHRAVQAAGIGIAQRGMIAAEQVEAVGQRVFGGVGKGVVGAAGDDAGEQQVGEEAVPGDLAEADDDADAGESADLGGEVDGTVANLLGCGLVAGRGAADDGGDPGMAQAESIVAGDGPGFAGEAELVEHGIHEIAGAVAGEGATGAVCAVGSGGEAEDEHAGARITETGHRARPVDVILVGSAAGFSDASAIVAQAGTEFAADDRVANAVQIRRGSWKLGQNLRQMNLGLREAPPGRPGLTAEKLQTLRPPHR
jgi:hypothetical protein